MGPPVDWRTQNRVTGTAEERSGRSNLSVSNRDHIVAIWDRICMMAVATDTPFGQRRQTFASEFKAKI